MKVTSVLTLLLTLNCIGCGSKNSNDDGKKQNDAPQNNVGQQNQPPTPVAKQQPSNENVTSVESSPVGNWMVPVPMNQGSPLSVTVYLKITPDKYVVVSKCEQGEQVAFAQASSKVIIQGNAIDVLESHSAENVQGELRCRAGTIKAHVIFSVNGSQLVLTATNGQRLALVHTDENVFSDGE